MAKFKSKGAKGQHKSGRLEPEQKMANLEGSKSAENESDDSQDISIETENSTNEIGPLAHMDKEVEDQSKMEISDISEIKVEEISEDSLERLAFCLKVDKSAEVIRKIHDRIQSSENPKAFVQEFIAYSDCNPILDTFNDKRVQSGCWKTILQCLTAIISNLDPDVKQYRDITLRIARRILRTPKESHLTEFLQQKRPDRLKVSLYFLKALVVFGGKPARLVIDFVTTLEFSPATFLKRVNYAEDSDVQGCYLDLLLAFLTSIDHYMIDKVVYNSGMLQSTYPFLKGFRSDYIIRFLAALHECLLTNPDVNKNVKRKLFSPINAKHIITLLNWERPTQLKKIKHDLAFTEQEEVRQAALDFMIILCSSSEVGVINESSGCKWQNSDFNKDVYNIICSVANLGKSIAGKHILIEVFTAAPELLPRYMQTLKPLYSSKVSTNFVSVIKMLSEIVESQRPWQWADSRGLEGVMASLFPGNPLDQRFFMYLVKCENIAVRHFGTALILVILKKAKETLENLHRLYSSAVLVETFKSEVIKELDTVFTMELVKVLITNWETIVNNPNSNSKESSEFYVPPAVELITIVECLWYFSELSQMSCINEYLKPIVPVKTVQFVKDYNDVKSINIGEEFWTSVDGLLRNSINKLTLNMNADAFSGNFSTLFKTFVMCSSASGSKNTPFDFVDILSFTLDRLGLADDCKGIQCWLKYITGMKHEKLSSFFTEVIHQTLKTYSHYTDDLIELRESFVLNEKCSLFTAINTTDLDADNGFLFEGFNKPFSRFVLAAVDLLSATPDKQCIEYFSNVLEDYLPILYNPSLLIAFLSDKSSVLTGMFQEYIALFGMHPDLVEKSSSSTDTLQTPNLSKALKASFMAGDVVSLDTVLSQDTLYTENDVHLLVSQVLMYLHINLKKENSEGTAFVEKYAALLKNMYVSMREQGNDQSSAVIVKTVLGHPLTKVSYRPLSSEVHPLSSVCNFFVSAALENHSGIALCTYPYFVKIMSDLKSILPLQDEQLDIWSCTLPFVTAKTSPLSYKDVEELFYCFLQLPCPLSPSHGPFLLKVLELLITITGPKRQLGEEAAESVMRKYIEWIAVSKKDTPIVTELVKTLEEFLPKILTEKIVKEITKEELKSLLFDSSSCHLCLRILEVYPPHGKDMASLLKNYQEDIRAKAPIVNALLKREEVGKTVKKLVSRLADAAKEWAVWLREEKVCLQDLFLYCLKADILDGEDLVEICIHIDDQCLTEKIFPKQDLAYLIALCGKVMEKVDEGKRPFSNANHFVFHILINSVINGCKLGTEDAPLLIKHCDMLDTLVKDMVCEELRGCVIDRNRWGTLVKQILRRGLNDQSTGPRLIQTLSVLIEGLYKNKSKVEIFEGDIGLTLRIICELVFSHTQFIPLMFSKETEFGKLKESVVNFLQVIVNADLSLCMEEHVPILLGGYRATMSSVDQRILKLLHCYEKAGAMKMYQPIIWGDKAVRYFSCLRQTEEYLEPEVSLTLRLLDKEKILRTCYQYDTELPLKPGIISGDDRTIYDMRFLIPVMFYLAEGDFSEIDFAESGVVAVGLACLSSHHEEVWGAGATLLKCVAEKMAKSAYGRFKLPWLWMITIIRNSLSKPCIRLPSLTVHFLIHASCLLSSPHNPMYFPILRGLFIKPELQVLKVPQFSRFFTSSDVLHSRRHLLFLLDILSGIRYTEDYVIAEKSSTATMMLALLQSEDNKDEPEIKIQTLKVFEAMAQIPMAAKELVQDYNILTVLPMVIKSSLSKENQRIMLPQKPVLVSSLVLESVVKILSSLWHSVVFPKEKLPVFSSEKFPVFKSLQLTHSLKRKWEDSNSFGAEAEDNMSIKIKREDSSEDRMAPQPKKSKRESANANDQTKPSNSTKQPKLCPVLVEEYLTCFLYISPEVLEYASPVVAGQHLALMSNAVEFLTSETLKRNDNQDIHLGLVDAWKKRVRASIQWDHLHKNLTGYLSDAEEVRILGDRAEECAELWRAEKVSQLFEHKSVSSNKAEDNETLKGAVFRLLDVLG